MAKKTPKSEFTISLTLGDKTYKSKGVDALDALSKLEKPEKIMNKGVLTVSDGTRSRTQLYMPVRLRRLFYNPSFQAIQAKMLASFMK